VEKALEASRPDGDRRIGVVWHTQGAGKSLSMIFFVGILRRHPAMENPSFVIQVDRADLDNQLYSSFVAAKALVGTVHQAQTIPDLRRLLQTEGGEVICSTIEKFQTREDESRHPELSRRRNIIVIADEAHRTQYGFLGGFAEHLHVALPNASFIGYTATPIDKEDANTFLVFGDIIHTYDMQQATQDGAVVGLYYEPRLIPLDLVNPDIDADLQEITEAEDYEIEATTLERAKARWATVAEAAGRRERLEHLADDLLAHFRERCDVIDGKAMIVCMIRANCVKLYDALTGRPDCPEVKVVMTGYLAEDPPEWSQAGHITTHTQREAIKARFKDPEDPLRLVIVCDMWLTGFDNPCLHTLYVDKPMKGHNLMQAIARVNRVFRDKPAGVIVDYIGIGDELRAATRKYTAAGGRGELAPELQTEAVAVFLDQLDRVRAFLPAGQPYHRWRDLPGIELEDLLNLCYGTLAPDEETRDHFLTEEKRLSKAFSLVKHLDVGRQHTEEVALYQLVRRQLRKTEPQQTMQMRQLEGAVQDLLDESITAQPAVDIFRVAGLDRADISILDDEFLAGFKPGATTDLQLKLLEKLLEDEIRLRRRSNLAKYRSFQEMLEDALRRYHNNTIQAADVVRVMVEIRRQMLEDDRRKSELGLTDEELAFYDAITYGEEAGLVQDIDFLAELVQEVVEAIKRNLQVDWTRDHRQDVYAGVQSAVKLVLRKRRIRGEQFRFILRRVMQQAEAGYEDWPMVA
ncbi:MAG: type I restriction endonuclease subunit R, partial [Anaerolineae bacterium]